MWISSSARRPILPPAPPFERRVDERLEPFGVLDPLDTHGIQAVTAFEASIPGLACDVLSLRRSAFKHDIPTIDDAIEPKPLDPHALHGVRNPLPRYGCAGGIGRS